MSGEITSNQRSTIYIVSGFAGQINLAHGFFVGIGTYTSAIVGGIASTSVIGYELDMVI